MGSSGKGLGTFALLLAIGALGLGVYQIILLAPSSPEIPEVPKIYVAQCDYTVWLDENIIDYIPQLNITYNTKAEDSVLFEFSCQLVLDIVDTTTRIEIYFEIDGTPATSSKIYKVGYFSDNLQPIYDSAIMRHHISNSTAGSHTVQVLTYIDDDGSASYVRYNVLTVTVY